MDLPQSEVALADVVRQVEKQRETQPDLSLETPNPLITEALQNIFVSVLIPLGACFLRASSLSLEDFWATVWTARARSAYLLTFGAALAAALINSVLGLLIGWLVIRVDLALTGPKGRGGRRAEEAGPHRPEPRRFAEL